MIEGITIALQSHYDTVKGATDILEKTLTQIKTNYIGAMLAEKIGEAKEIYNNTVADSRNANYKACVQILDEVMEQSKKVLEVPVPSDFTATIEALKAVKDKTPTEMKTVGDAYKNNYFAYRAICDIMGGVKPVTIADIEESVDYLKENLYRCFYSDNLEAYRFQNWLKGSLISSADEMFTAFIEGRFEDAVKPDTESEEN